MKTTKITSMTVEDIQTATNELKQVRQAMPFILPLSPAERDACGRLGAKSAANTQMRLALVREHKDSLPPSFDLRRFEQEAALFTALAECLATVGEIQADVRDTFLAIGRTAV